MKIPPRPVVVVTVQGRTVRLTVANNGAAFTVDDVAQLARLAGLEPRVVRASLVVLPLSALPDFEAAAKVRRVVVQRRRGSAPAAPLTFQPSARQGVDEGPEPVHACARDACRTPGCRHVRRSA